MAIPFNPAMSQRTKTTHFRKRMIRRKANKEVQKKLDASKPRNKPTYQKANRKAIYTLAKQVKDLQLERYGEKQYQQQACKIYPNNAVPNTYPTLENPFLFAANAFYNNTMLFRGQVQGNGEATFTNAGPVGPGLNYTLAKADFDNNLLNDQYNWNAFNSQQQVSPIEYLPIYAKYKFRFHGNIGNMPGGPFTIATPFRYRITMFKIKRTPTPNLVKDLSLPDRLGAYWHMCDDNLLNRNYFSKSYHKIIADKWVTFQPPADPSANASIFKDVHINIPFEADKPIRPLMLDVPIGQQFWTNVPEKDIIWCLISTNLPNSHYTVSNFMPNIQIERTLMWRDAHGVTA